MGPLLEVGLHFAVGSGLVLVASGDFHFSLSFGKSVSIGLCKVACLWYGS